MSEATTTTQHDFFPMQEEKMESLSDLIDQADKQIVFPETPHDGWELSLKGVTMITKAKNKEDSDEEKKVSGPCWVEALNRDHSSNNWGLLIKWLDADRKEHELPVAQERILGSGDNNLAKELSRGGLRIKNVALLFAYFHDYIEKYENDPSKRYRCVQSAGWSDRELIYVTPHAVLQVSE